MRFIFHLPGSWLGPGGSGLMPFYRNLIDGLERQGIEVELRVLDRMRVMQDVESDSSFHVVNHGQFSHPRLRNVGLAYVYPFWHVDPKGIRAHSSIADAAFDPRGTDAVIARAFFRRQVKRLVGARRSRYPQPDAVPDLPEDPIAVFLQSEAHRGVAETSYLTPLEMVETILTSQRGPVVAKLHPLDHEAGLRTRMYALAREYPQFHIANCNIHDLLARARKVVTINSAVGIEAYLHRKPVILCGKADFHHIATVARSADDLRSALEAPVKARPYDKYIHWYFAQQCLATTDPDLTDRFVARFVDGTRT